MSMRRVDTVHTTYAQGSAEPPNIILDVSNETMTHFSALPRSLLTAAEHSRIIASSASPPSVLTLVLITRVGILSNRRFVKKLQWWCSSGVDTRDQSLAEMTKKSSVSGKEILE